MNERDVLRHKLAQDKQNKGCLESQYEQMNSELSKQNKFHSDKIIRLEEVRLFTILTL